MYRIYCRVSTEQQAESGHGINAQVDACTKYADLNPYDIYVDAGVSGGTHISERPGMVKLLREFHKGDILLVTQRDRMGRDPIIVAILEKTIEEKGGTIISLAGEGTGGDSPSDILIRRVVDAISEYVRLNGRMRVKAAMKAKKDRSERVGSIPYGWRLSPDGIHLEKDDGEQGVIRQAQNMRVSGYSYAKIADMLFSGGIYSRTGKAFLGEQVKRMVQASNT